MPTWDDAKRRKNLREHGLDFEGSLFDGPVVVLEDKRDRYGELRLNAIGWLHGQVVHLTYTERDDDFHVISLRKEEKHEVRNYVKETTR